MEEILEFFIPIIRNIVISIFVLIIGLYIIKLINKKLNKYLKKNKVDNTLTPFIASIITTGLKIALVISIISILGIDTTSFVAFIASAGFAIGLAFQGSLSNFAGGVLLLTIRPFKVGDYIQCVGMEGTVKSIQILYTELTTVDNKIIFIPNGILSNTSIIKSNSKK